MFMSRCVVESAHALWVLTGVGEYVEDGGKLDGHDDVPEDIRKDLIAQSQGRIASKKAQGMDMPYHPININVLPPQPGTRESTGVATPPQHPTTLNHLVLPGPGAVREYCRWLESRATEEAYRADIRKACQVTLENLMDLELMMGAQDPGFLTKKGIKEGTALRFIRDIPEWSALQGNLSGSEVSESLADSGVE
ncbi:hypothetical protein BDW71DRAFT_212774 [Aspergillus fruticulosus]